MALAVDPAPSSEELAAILAALAELDEPASAAHRAKPSRWKSAARVYDDAWEPSR